MHDTPFRLLARDWYGEPVPGNPAWCLALEGGGLVLRARVEAAPMQLPDDGEGRFVEGLWTGDAAEAFLLNPATGYYLELNLAPGGAWWACGHTAPRVRVPTGAEPLRGVRTWATRDGDGWTAMLRVPVASLPPALVFDPATTRGNVAFCLGQPRRYLSAVDLGGGSPDFHRPAHWVPLRELLAGGASPQR